MSNIIKNFEEKQLKELKELKDIPSFVPGDTIKVGYNIIEGKNSRIQYFQGICIARRNRSIDSSFTVRKLSDKIGVERCFSLYSPNVVSIEVIKLGKVRRAKLYYLRDRIGKAARVKEKRISKSTKNKINKEAKDNS